MQIPERAADGAVVRVIGRLNLVCKGAGAGPPHLVLKKSAGDQDHHQKGIAESRNGNHSAHCLERLFWVTRTEPLCWPARGP